MESTRNHQRQHNSGVLQRDSTPNDPAEIKALISPYRLAHLAHNHGNSKQLHSECGLKVNTGSCVGKSAIPPSAPHGHTNTSRPSYRDKGHPSINLPPVHRITRGKPRICSGHAEKNPPKLHLHPHRPRDTHQHHIHPFIIPPPHCISEPLHLHIHSLQIWAYIRQFE